MKSLVLLLLITAATAAKLPKSFKRCAQKSPDFNECIIDAIQDGIKQIAGGFPKLGLPIVEPLGIPTMTIGAGKGAVNLVQNFKDVEIHGLTTLQLTNQTKIDLEKKTIELDFFVPECILDSTYDFNGKILVLPVVGTGHARMNLVKLHGKASFVLEQIDKNGKHYLKVIENNLTLDPEIVKFLLENLFNGDKALGDNVNKVMNDNSKEVFADIKEGYEGAFSKIVQSLANNVFDRVAIEDLFLD